MKAIEFRDVSLAYGDDLVVEEFTLAVDQGEIVCLFGPSGCGKSTLLKSALGMLIPRQGAVDLEGVAADRYELPISYVPQDNELFRWLNVYENVTLWHRESRRDSPMPGGVEPKEALEAVGLSSDGDKMPYELSGGMARRTALARGLATSGRVVLMDEAFISVERKLRRELMCSIRTHIKQNEISALLISHDFEEAIFMSDRVVVLSAVPARIDAVLRVELPPDRDMRVFDSPEFRQTAMNLIRE